MSSIEILGETPKTGNDYELSTSFHNSFNDYEEGMEYYHAFNDYEEEVKNDTTVQLDNMQAMWTAQDQDRDQEDEQPQIPEVEESEEEIRREHSLNMKFLHAFNDYEGEVKNDITVQLDNMQAMWAAQDWDRDQGDEQEN